MESRSASKITTKIDPKSVENECRNPKMPLTCVSKPVPGVHGKRGVGEGLAEKVGEGLAKGWQRVGGGIADFLAPSNFGIPEAPV